MAAALLPAAHQSSARNYPQISTAELFYLIFQQLVAHQRAHTRIGTALAPS
jgi:hypothetical protein